MEFTKIRQDFVDGKVTFEELQRFMGLATPLDAIVPVKSRASTTGDKINEVAKIKQDFVDGKVTVEEFQRFVGLASPLDATVTDKPRDNASGDKIDAVVGKVNHVRDNLDAHANWVWGALVFGTFIYPVVTVVMLLVWKCGIQWIAVLAKKINDFCHREENATEFRRQMIDTVIPLCYSHNTLHVKVEGLSFGIHIGDWPECPPIICTLLDDADDVAKLTAYRSKLDAEWKVRHRSLNSIVEDLKFTFGRRL